MHAFGSWEHGEDGYTLISGRRQLGPRQRHGTAAARFGHDGETSWGRKKKREERGETQ